MIIFNRLALIGALLTALCLHQASAYQVIVDFNTFSQGFGDGSLLKADGVYNIPQNSNLTTAQWQALYAALGPGWVVSEDNPGSSASYNTITNTFGIHVDDAVCYNETGATPGGTLLSDAQISTQAPTHGGHVVALTRDYNTTWPAWRTETDRALNNSLVSGIVMETSNPYANQACDLLVSKALSLNKRVYFLLPGNNTSYALSSIQYLQSKVPTQMQDPRVFILIYDYSKNAAHWFGGVNTQQGTFYQARAIATGVCYQAEGLTIANYLSAAGGSARQLGTDTSLSNSNGMILDSNNAGDYMTFVVPNISAGNYNIKVGVKKNTSRGIFQLEVGRADNFNGTFSNIGGIQDEYASTIAYSELNLGAWAPGTTSDKWFRFLVTGKNSASGGTAYNDSIAVDYIKLTPQ